MKSSLILLFIIVIFYSPLKAQDFVIYHGDAEKALISTAQTPDDLIKLAFATELNNDEYELLYSKLVQDVKQLKLEAIANDKSERHLKKIYQLVHDHFLRNFNPHAHFGDFVFNGEYQCLSASILYAYILETLDIPYQITQFPGHIYVFADPKSANVKFETIDETKGFYVFDDQTKQTNVNELVNEGYIDQSYAMRVGVERAFDEFFYNKTDISLKEAVGLLYFYKALDEMQADKINEAYSDISKSDILFPDKKNDYFKNKLMAGMVNNLKYDDLKDWRALTQLVNNKNATENIKKYLIFQFENFLIVKLINSGQKDKVNEVYNYLHTNIIDTAEKKHVSEDYFFESAQYSYITGDYAQALNCLEIAYGVNPNNPLIISNFVQMILHKYGAQSPSAQSLALFDKYMNSYPLLKNNKVIASIYEYYMSYMSISGFVIGNGATGEKYMQSLIQELDAHPDDDNKYQQYIASVFARASVYYWAKQQKQKAITVLKVGLKYEPNNDELQRKLQADGGN